VAVRRTTVAARAAGLRKPAAGPAPARFRTQEEAEHKAAALPVLFHTPVADYIGAERPPVRFRTPVAHYTAAEQLLVLFRKLAERRKQAAAEVRPVLLSKKGPAAGRRVQAGRRLAHWGLDLPVLLLP
jgi:hypothetical protein